MKYDIKFSCGHTETRELFGKNSERERKIDYFEQSGLCSECYKKACREEEAKQPIKLLVNIAPYQQKIILSFEGNTMPAKNEIKKLGYSWGDIPMTGALGLFTYAPKKVWYRIIDDIDQLAGELEKTVCLKPVIENRVTPLDIAAWRHVLDQKAAFEKAKAEIEKPKVPAKLLGTKWNQKVYGRKGNYTIYPNGIITEISDDEALEIEKYLLEKATYLKKIEELKNKIKAEVKKI